MSTTAAPAAGIRRIAFTSLAGTSIEWFDFFLYGTAAALVFPAVFFAADMPPLVSLLASFSTFAVGFLARPLGGVLFGHFGDRAGRKKALVIALMMMGLSTTLIGCLPGYATIGPWAPVLLILLRFVQGLAIGGQWGGAVLLITESAPREQRGFWGSFAQVGAPAGVVLANLAFLVVTELVSPGEFMEWGWRLPFLSSVILVGLSLYVQVRLEDTTAFQKLEKPQGRSPVIEAFRRYPKEIFLAAGAFLSVQIAFYILITFVIAYGTRADGLALPRTTMLMAVLVGTLVMIPSVVISGALSDRFGRRRIYLWGAALTGLWSFAIFPLVDTGQFVWICTAIAVGQMFVSLMYGPQAALLSEMFSTEVRYSSASLGYQLGSIIGGSFAPIIATALLAAQNATWGISLYMATGSAIAFACAWHFRDARHVEMH
jgi:metabolite-proton symporter